MKKALYLVACLFISISCSKDSSPPSHPTQAQGEKSTSLKITTFNVKWFGIGGTMWNRPEQEFRSHFLRQFIQEELSDSDIIGFTEVVRTDALQKMLEGLYQCVSYKGRWSRHQHVVLCFDPKKYRVEKYDEDYVIQDVDLGNGGLRPAVQAKICHLKGKCFLQVLGVHLVAGPKSKKRFRQVKKIRDELFTHTQTLPSLIFGDFNSYRKERNGLDKDDINIIEDLLNETDYKFSSVTKGIPSYGTGQYGRDYDHIVVTHDIKVHDSYGYLACQENPPLNQQFIPYRSFNKYFSDHCPVTAQLEVPNPTE